MVVKGILREDFSKNYLGELSNSSFRRLTHDCFEKNYPAIHLGSLLLRTKTFCFENNVFLTFGLGMREGVSEGSGSGKW